MLVHLLSPGGACAFEVFGVKLSWHFAKLCFYSFLSLSVCLIFQEEGEKVMFLKFQLSVFAKTNVTLDDTYELTRRLTVLFFPTGVWHKTLLLLAIH